MSEQNTFSYGRMYTREEIEASALHFDDSQLCDEGIFLAYADVREYVFLSQDEDFVLNHTWKRVILGR